MMNDRLPPFRCGEDFASSWLEDELEIVTPFYLNSGTFACRTERGRKAKTVVAVQHHMGPFASTESLALLQQKLGRVLTPSHRVLLSRWDGCTLFTQPGYAEPNGLRLYSSTELADLHGQVTAVVPTDRSADLFIIGEMQGQGACLALDDSIPSGGESPLVVLYESGMRDRPIEISIVANTLTELLMHLMEAPATMLERLGGVRYHANGKQLVPVTYRMG